MNAKLPPGMDDERALAQTIIDNLPEPLLVLDHDLRVVVASQSYYLAFNVGRQDVQGRAVFALGNGQWDSPELRGLLEEILTRHTTMKDYEVDREFPGIGPRIMLLGARKMAGESGGRALILLSIEDVTARRSLERQMAEVLRQKDVLLLEIQHRVANSLQIIASILLLKAQSVQSEETRRHLQDAHRRVLSVAAVQQQLLASGRLDLIQLAPYLAQLCETLAASMIGDTRPIALKVQAAERAASSNEAVSIGLIVTELLINALKHAFPDDKSDAAIVVDYAVSEPNWRLTVCDNGIGEPAGDVRTATPGLGTGIIEALAKQLDAKVHISMTPDGTSVSITHGTMLPQFASSLPAAADAKSANRIARPRTPPTRDNVSSRASHDMAGASHR